MKDLFFELIRVAIGTQDRFSRIPSESEWDELFELAKKQSLVGITFIGLQKLGADADEGYTRIGMSEETYLTWMGVAARIQLTNGLQKKFIGKLARLYQSVGVSMMLLKGQGIAALYKCGGSKVSEGSNVTDGDLSQFRQPGDVDVYLFGGNDKEMPAWKQGDKAVEKLLGVSVRLDSEHHTKFVKDDFTVENHYDFVNTRIRKSSAELEKMLKELAEDHSHVMEFNGQKVYLPSDRLNALFLLRHASIHFAADGITLKNIMDWGFFVQSAQDMDWDWLWAIARKYNMHLFLACMNAICSERLGFKAEGLRNRDLGISVDEFARLKERVLAEIMNGVDAAPGASAIVRTKRWWQHRWKHSICYSDSILSSFIYSIRANLTKASVE